MVTTDNSNSNNNIEHCLISVILCLFGTLKNVNNFVILYHNDTIFLSKLSMLKQVFCNAGIVSEISNVNDVPFEFYDYLTFPLTVIMLL